MHKQLIYSILSGLITGSLFAAEVVIIEEDFEGAGDTIVPGGPVTITNIVDDPEVDGTRGKVMEIALDGTAVWGGLNTEPLRVALLPLGIAPGNDTYEFTADIYIPADTALLAPDSTGLRVRWTDEAESGKTEFAEQPTVDSIVRDEWVTLTLSGDIPLTFGDGDPTTHIRPLYSIYDNVNADPDNRADGLVMYLDNVKIIANTSGEDPNILLPETSPFGVVDSDSGIVTRTHTLSNSGVSNDLIISEASISGDDADSYGIVTEIPLTIPPGESRDIEITFDTVGGPGAYSATLEITSNDALNGETTAPLDALIVDPTGTDLIINGGFETGNTIGFNSNQTFEVTTAPAEPVHTGNHAAVYTLAGGNQWGSFELDQPAPPAAEGFPNRIAITERMIGQNYRFSCWYYRPATDGIADDDRVQMIIRWNALTPDSGPFSSLSGADLGTGTWVEYIEEGIVPATWPEDDTGVPIDSAFLIFSIRDTDSNGLGTEQVYVDDLQFTVDLAPLPDPDVFPVIVSSERDPETGFFTFEWTSANDQTYRLEYSDDLQNWLEIDDEYPADIDTPTTIWTDTTTAGVDLRYFRVHLNLEDPGE